MDTAVLQDTIARFVEERDLGAPVEARMLDLVSEVGEAAKEIVKGSGYGRSTFDSGEPWGDELGDVFFSLICLANSTDVDLGVALRRTLEKYDRRLTRAGDAGSGR